MENSECVLCGDCIKLCPHNSPLVNLRLPARELWSSRRLSAVLPVLVPVMIATQVLRLADHAGLLNPLKGLDAAGPVLAVLIVLIWAVTQALVWGLRRLGAMRQEGDAAGAELSTTWAAETSVALTFVGLTPLVVGCEIAYQLGSLLGRGPEALAILSRLVGWRPLSDIVFLPWQITAVELVALSLGLGLTFIVEKKAENPRLRAPGITGAVLLYLLFAGLVLLA